jgi:DNA-binding NarL/FixJ family response regulator
VAFARVLIVDDALVWQDLLIKRLSDEPKLEIIGVAADGLTAVQKAMELQPDLILLDLNLPQLNGLDAARQIRILSPFSRILFVSGEGDPEIRRAAIKAGGSGYVLKGDVDSDLISAIEVVLSGETFIDPEIIGADE